MTIYAEDVNYWKTGKSSTDTWLDNAKREIRAAGGKVAGEGFVSESLTGRSSFLLAFELQGEQFKMLWPVLKSKTGNERAAKIQAATALYHEVKAACVKAKFLGARAAFFAYLLTPGGQTISELGSQELGRALPMLLGGESTLRGQEAQVQIGPGSEGRE